MNVPVSYTDREEEMMDYGNKSPAEDTLGPIGNGFRDREKEVKDNWICI